MVSKLSNNSRFFVRAKPLPQIDHESIITDDIIVIYIHETDNVHSRRLKWANYSFLAETIRPKPERREGGGRRMLVTVGCSPGPANLTIALYTPRQNKRHSGTACGVIPFAQYFDCYLAAGVSATAGSNSLLSLVIGQERMILPFWQKPHAVLSPSFLPLFIVDGWKTDLQFRRCALESPRAARIQM